MDKIILYLAILTFLLALSILAGYYFQHEKPKAVQMYDGPIGPTREPPYQLESKLLKKFEHGNSN